MDRNTLSIVLFLLVIVAVISATIAITPIPPLGAFGTALNGSTFPAFSCTDSDGGYAPNQLGSTYGTQSGSYANYTDTCITVTVLKEYYCSGSFIANAQYDCSTDSAVCANGACMQASS